MNIAVYLGSKSGNDPEFASTVRELGRWIAQNGHTLVYGGSNGGLMGEVAGAVRENGGRIIGVGVNVQRILNAKFEGVDEYINTEDLQERKKVMMRLADVFVVMPGSVGTLDELTDIMATFKIDLLDKPCFVCDINGFYRSLAKQLEKMVAEGFATTTETKNVTFVKNSAELLRGLGSVK